MPFRISSKYIFLTYPQSTDLPHEELHGHLDSIPAVQSVYSCREKHENGTDYHHHAIVESNSKFNIKNERYFDIQFGGRCFHPSCEPVRDLASANRYIGKDGHTKGHPIRGSRQSRKTDYEEIIRTSDNISGFLEAVRERDPINYVLNLQRLEYFAERRFASDINYGVRYTQEQFRVPTTIDEWVRTQLFNRPARPKCLVIVGEPGWGKTKWAQSLGVPFNYWMRYLTRRRKENAWYAIMDDFDDMGENEHKGFWGCQEVIGVKVSNGVSGHQQWEWGIPTIWLFNKLPEFLERDSYQSKRSVVVTLNRAMY